MINFDKLREEYQDISKELSQEGSFKNRERFTQLSKRLSFLERILNLVKERQNYLKERKHLQEVIDDANEEELYFQVQLPHGWVAGSDIEAHIHWTPAANGGVGEVVCWGLEYIWVNMGDVAGNTTIISANDTAQGDASLVANKHYLTELGTIDGTGKTWSSMLSCRVFRDAGGALKTDDYGDDAGMLEIDFRYQIESLGSRTEYA